MTDNIPRRKFGFQVAGDVLDRKTDIAVYLNGEDVTRRCKCADDILGFVVLYTTHPPTLDPMTGDSYRELKLGDVQIFACEKEDA